MKNACGSVLNAMEKAAALIATGRCRTALTACEEVGSPATRWHGPDHEALIRAVPGRTVPGAGAALVLTAGPADQDAPAC
ncbi:hypothetical protein RND61_09910 [Streptomyces sp. TRM76323]|uniref:Uncharacterized protein n=1 Tax=Streptomyces tamarix TaxID=3078565 RepID=A0ABU3QHY9_9ACTN|nr:hypothetical protein [Streptomyces tamarix]MDT9682382.1 hypothetical protein [Streptomyces tamarix]